MGPVGSILDAVDRGLARALGRLFRLFLAAVSAVLCRLPTSWSYWLWTELTVEVAERDVPPPGALGLEGRKVLGLVRWYLDAMEPPRPTWAALERWANLDDPSTAELRAEEVRSRPYHREG